MENFNRTVENIEKMLKYLYFEIAKCEIDKDNIESLDDAYAVVIAYWCTMIAKEGLKKEYVIVEDDEVTSPRGQINVQETINRQSLQRGAIVCSYDELSSNIKINQILKGTLQYILINKSDNDFVKTKIKKAMIAFNGIDTPDLKYISWGDIRFDNDTMRYKHLIDLCKTYYFEDKLVKRMIMSDDDRLYMLFKKQACKYFIKKYAEVNDETDINVSKFIVPYELGSEKQFEKELNREQVLVAIENGASAMIFMARLDDKEDVAQDGKIGRKRLEELAGYLALYKEETGIGKVNGCMCYVNTNRKRIHYDKMQMNKINSYLIGEITIDIHDLWRYTDEKIKEPYNYFLGKKRTQF